MKTTLYVPILLALVASFILGGCGGSGEQGADKPVADQSALQPDKVLPNLDVLGSDAQTKVLPELLTYGALPTAGIVGGTQCSWFRTPVPTKNTVVVVTLQQPKDQDSDLYVYSNWPMRTNWKLGQSSRFATSTMLDYTAMGVPDWVACTLTKSTGSGWLMVYGEGAAGSNKPFTLETDVVKTLSKTSVVTHDTAAYRDSKWYRFSATSGKLHTITCTAAKGSDPDMVLYDANSAGYKASSYTVGSGGKITFTPTNTHMHYLRVYGNGNVRISTYDLKLVIAP